MPNFLPDLLHLFRPRRAAPSGPALVLRLDNMAALTDLLGPAAVVALLGHLASRVSAAMRLRSPARSGPGGDLRWRLPRMSDRATLDFAVRLQTLVQAEWGPQDGIAQAALGAAVLRPCDDVLSDDELFARGQAWLDRRRSVDMGRVALLDACAIAPPEELSPHRRDTPPFQADWIEAAFQPQLSCDTGEVSGFRAVARLRHPDRGVLRPADFLPALTAVQTRALTQAMLRHALGALPRWDRAGFSVPQVSLIVTAPDLSQPDFAESVLWELDRMDQPPSRLALEVEGVAATEPAARKILSRLTGCGCTLDLRDFGTSGASLDALRSLAPARVMIGPGFTAGCDADVGAQQMILAVLSLAGHLNLRTLGRAVATSGEHGFLAQIGCAEVQGPAIAPAMTLTETMGYLDRLRATRVALPDFARRA